MTFLQQKSNLLQIFIGFFVLLVGTLVYIVDRPPEQTYFVSKSILDISLYDMLPNLFGIIGNSLPDFTHVFAFTMITAGIVSSRTKGSIVITGLWFLIDAVFELGQKFDSIAANMVPECFDSVPLLKNTPIFFKNGTFDWFDIAAILIGSISSFFILQITMKKETTP